MNPPPHPGSRPLWRRLALALGIGLVATVAGSAAGAVVLGLGVAVGEGPQALRATPAFVVYGVILGPVLAWPATLLALPALWLLAPVRRRRPLLPAAGAVAGALSVLVQVTAEAGLDSLGWTMLTAGAVGGLSAGGVFAAFVPKSDARGGANSALP